MRVANVRAVVRARSAGRSQASMVSRTRDPRARKHTMKQNCYSLAACIAAMQLLLGSTPSIAQKADSYVRKTTVGSLELMLMPGSFSWGAAQMVPANASFRRDYGQGWIAFCPTSPAELLAVSNLVRQAANDRLVEDGTQIALGLWQIVTATTNDASGSVNFNEPSGGWVALSPGDIETSPLQRALQAPYFTPSTPFDTNNGRRSRGWRLPSAWGPGLNELGSWAVDTLFPGTAAKIPNLISNVTSLALQQPDKGDEDFGALYIKDGRRGEVRGNDCKVSAVCRGGVLMARLKPSIAGNLPSWPRVKIGTKRRALQDGETLDRVVKGSATVISWTWKGRQGYLALWDDKGNIYVDGTKAIASIDLRTLPAGVKFHGAIRNITSAPDPFERFEFTTR